MMVQGKENIETFRLMTLKQALKLHKVGLRSRGRAATTVARKDYGLKGNVDSLIRQVEDLIQERLNNSDNLAV